VVRPSDSGGAARTRSSCTIAVLLLVLGLAACARAQPKAVPDAMRCGHALPERCGGRGPRYSDLPSHQRPERAPVVVSRVSELATLGKRAFDAGRWQEAATHLERAARGEGDDDLGTRQRSEYDLAIAHDRLGHVDAAADLLTRIVAKPAHLKRRDAELALMRLVTSGCGRVDVLHGVASIEDWRFERAEHAATLKMLWFARSRAKIEIGKRNAAEADLSALADAPEWRDVARECLKPR
jgi:hypothetical protein